MSAETSTRSAYRLPAKLGDLRVVLIDYSAEGLLLEHYRPLRSEGEPVFVLEWDGERVEEPCRVASSDKFPIAWGSPIHVFRTSLEFVRPEGRALDIIGRIIQERHRLSVALQVANASGRSTDPTNEPVFQDGLVRGSSSEEDGAPEFLRMCWNGCSWSSVCTPEPAQPPNGFTIDAAEPSKQIHSLCELYEVASAEGRRMIQEQARLSLEEKVSGRRRRPSGQRTGREYNGRPSC
jgi:hypothetical protein